MIKTKVFTILFIISLLAAFIIPVIPNKAEAVTTDIIDVFYGSDYDGYITSIDATYNTAHDPTSWNNVNVNYSGISFLAGQKNAASLYYIYRGVVFFDTSSLPSNITISSAELSLCTRDIRNEDESAYSIFLTPPGDQSEPPVYSGFTLFTLETYLGSEALSSFIEDSYTDIAITYTDVVNREGITKIGVRTSFEFLGVAPDASNDDYVDFWAAESSYSPKLTVHYTVNDLGSPNIFRIENTAVFNSYVEEDDQIYVFGANVQYNETPEEYPGEYFVVRLYNGTDIKAEVPLKYWNYSPLSIYLSPEAALSPSGNYTLSLEPVSGMFVSPPDSYTYDIEDNDWKGEAQDSEVFRNWIYIIAGRMGTVDEIGILGYRDTIDSSLLNQKATNIFTETIPYINTLYPDRFVVVGQPLPSGDIDITDDQSAGLYAQWGSYWLAAWDGVGAAFGVPGYWIVSFAFLITSIIVIMLLSRKIPSPLVYLAVLPVMAIGLVAGVPIWIATMIMVLAIMYFSYNVIARGLN